MQWWDIIFAVNAGETLSQNKQSPCWLHEDCFITTKKILFYYQLALITTTCSSYLYQIDTRFQCSNV